MKHKLTVGLSALTGLLFAACGGGSSGGGGSASQMDLVEASNGFGLMLPHQVYRADPNGNPTSQLVAIRSVGDLLDNVSATNPILPVTEWPVSAGLPNGEAGNHFIYVEFTQPIKINSVLDSSPGGQANSGLLGPITVIALNPTDGTSVPVSGRAFVGGKTFAGVPSGSPPKLELQQWVGLDASGKPVALDVGGAFPGQGFPFTQSTTGVSGAAKLVSPRTFVFVPDTNGDLSDHETFPPNRQIRLRATSAVLGTNGEPLVRQVLASATVGVDTLPPEVAVTPPPNSVPVTTPSFGDSDVDPSTNITMEFTEPVQPLTLAPLPSNGPPGLSAAVLVSFGPQTQVTNVPFTALPLSVYDLSVWSFDPVFAFPGNGPASVQCGTFNEVRVKVNPSQFQDLSGNANALPQATMFTTGEGPGLVNAPVAPDVIYAMRVGATPGISVIDLNGFGQSTGNPAFDFLYQSFPKGNSNFPNNPNVKLQGTLIVPQLTPGTCTVDGGSAGVFTLTRDSSLNTLLLRSPMISSVGDMMVGQSLDRVFNNSKDTNGCKSGGGSFCALDGKKAIQVAPGSSLSTNPHMIPGNDPTQPTIGGLLNQVDGGANPISWSPHPNPPPLIFPPLCVQPFIGGEEPTSFLTVLPPPPVNVGLGLTNLLKPGIPLNNPLNGQPPTGLLTVLQNVYFQGPDLASKPLNACVDHMIRQQVGHFLYMIDRARREIVVINSNRFTILDRIQVSDPTDLAMGPNLDFLAVSNQNSDIVQFIDINPASSNFHKVVKTTPVGIGPRGIAWDPGNEDILVCNEGENTVSIISAHSLNVRKVIKSHLNQPFDVAITQRQQGFGFLRNVYFGWIMNRNGDLTIFESGPNGVNGWGFDDTIGVAPMQFVNPKRVAVDYSNLNGGVWIVHENPLDANGNQTGIIGGAITKVVVDSAVLGQLPLTGILNSPQFREMTLQVDVSVGPDQLTGIPVDIAFDDLINAGSLANTQPTQGAGVVAQINGKSYVRNKGLNVFVPAKLSRFMFAAVPNSLEGPGVVDVINIASGNVRFDTDPYVTGVQSIPTPGVNAVIDYWRQ